MAKCNHKCFECEYDDCINNVLTKTERIEANQRDINFVGICTKNPKPTRAKRRNNR